MRDGVIGWMDRNLLKAKWLGLRHLIGGDSLGALSRLVRPRLISLYGLVNFCRHIDPGRLHRFGKLVGSIYLHIS